MAVAEAAEERQTAVALFIDEIQYFAQKELGALIMAMHKVQQRQLPLVLLGAGLPILPGLAGESKSYAERLFSFPDVGALSEPDAAKALREPARAAACDLTAAEKRDLIKLIEQGNPLLEKYRFLLFAEEREVELVWNGKSREVCTAILPFQTLEQVADRDTWGRGADSFIAMNLLHKGQRRSHDATSSGPKSKRSPRPRKRGARSVPATNSTTLHISPRHSRKAVNRPRDGRDERCAAACDREELPACCGRSDGVRDEP